MTRAIPGLRRSPEFFKKQAHPLDLVPGRDVSDIGKSPINNLAVAVLIQAYYDALYAPDDVAIDALMFLAVCGADWLDALGLERLGHPARVLGSRRVKNIVRFDGMMPARRGRRAKKFIK